MSQQENAWEVLKQVCNLRGYIVLAYRMEVPLGSIVREAWTDIPQVPMEYKESFTLSFLQPFRIMKQTDINDWKEHCQAIRSVTGNNRNITTLHRYSQYYRFYRAYTE